ncbi:MAG TPA: hypothetical protein PKA27_10605 [Fimbriimonadaceae bacterium]|nr:hypothetical protein [Fimbriimonadaceae bacterium]
MSFSARLATETISIEAGVTSPLGIEIANRGDEQDRFELTVEGLDPEWTAIPVPTFAVEAMENSTERIFFKPGRVSESLAGNYPFVVTVRSLISGEARTLQGVLEIKPFNHLSMEVAPRRGIVSAFKKDNEFTVSVVNLGNTEHVLQVFGNDPDDQCSFEISQEQISVGPGQQRDISVTVNPVKSSVLASSQLHGFAVSARSVSNPSLVCSAQAQLEVKPLLAPSSMLALLLATILALVWWAFRPQPPAIESLMLSKSSVQKGEDIIVTWKASNQTRTVLIEVNGDELYRGAITAGQKTFTAEESGMVVATAFRDEKSSNPASAPYTVTTPVAIPDPEIRAFDIQPRNPGVGQTVTVKFGFNDSVTKATLAPRGVALDPKVGTYQFEIDEPGEVSYQIVAENAEGNTVKSRSITLTVQQVSTASIIVFRAEPAELAGVGTVKLTWQLTDAVRAEINDGVSTKPLPDIKGEMEVEVTKSTQFILTGYDSKGVIVRQKLSIPVKSPPPPPTTGGDPTDDSIPPTTSTGGGN